MLIFRPKMMNLPDSEIFRHCPAAVRQLSGTDNAGQRWTAAGNSRCPAKSSFLSSKTRFFTVPDSRTANFVIFYI